MPALADSPALDKRIAQAVASLLAGIAGLSGVTIKLAESDGAIETPYISVKANRTGEAFYNSGVHVVNVAIHLFTTSHEGDNATDDETFLTYDAAIEQFCIAGSMKALATAIETEAEYVKIYNVREPASEPTEFTEEKRNIEYSFNCHAVGLAT